MALINDTEMPTDMVEKKEKLGGLRYADKKCWEFFAVVEYIYATMVTSDNFLRRGGKLLREICDAILQNNDLRRQFAYLCYTDKSEYSFDDTTTAFQFFLKVFGRVRAKDVALKYNSAVYKGKNEVGLRPKLASISGNNKKKQKTSGKGKKSEESDEEDEEDGKARHNAILKDLDDDENEQADNDKKIPSPVVEEMIEKDASDE